MTTLSIHSNPTPEEQKLGDRKRKKETENKERFGKKKKRE